MNMMARPVLEDDGAAAQHRRLSALNRARLAPGLPDADWAGQAAARQAAELEEERFLAGARARVADVAADCPRDAAGFVAWFEALRLTGPGQDDTLFPWLAARAPLAAMRWFLAQEVAGEAGFDDLTAMTMLRMPQRPKLELARNLWDEMGRGQARAMHGPLLERLAARLALDAVAGEIVWEASALANTMAGLAANRRYAFHAVGALGVVELTAPDRAAQVDAGLRRLGVEARDRHYFALHAVLDVKHSAAWNAEVIVPLVEAEPRVAVAIAEGALMRLACGAACFARYRAELAKDGAPF
jgi:hypothetical protein